MLPQNADPPWLLGEKYKNLNAWDKSLRCEAFQLEDGILIQIILLLFCGEEPRSVWAFSPCLLLSWLWPAEAPRTDVHIFHLFHSWNPMEMYTKYVKIFIYKIFSVSTQESILETTLQYILTVIILADRWGQCPPMLTFSLEHGPSYSYNDTMLDIITSAVTDVMRTARWGAGMLPYCFPVIVTLSVMAPSVWVYTWHSAVHTHRLERQATSCSPSF